MKDYWQTRLVGPYPDFSSGEVGAMILLSLNMTPVFPEVVSLLLRTTAPLNFSSFVGMTMKDSEVLVTFPKESEDLLAHLMRNASQQPVLVAALVEHFKQHELVSEENEEDEEERRAYSTRTNCIDILDFSCGSEVGQ